MEEIKIKFEAIIKEPLFEMIISDGFYIISKESLQHLEINETILLNHKKNNNEIII